MSQLPYCPKMKIAHQVCLQKDCNQHFLLCYDLDNCDCQNNHFQCCKIQWTEIINAYDKNIMKKRPQFKQFMKLMEVTFSRISKIFKKAYEQYRQWLDDFGLSKNGQQFMRLVKQKRLNELSREKMHLIIDQIQIDNKIVMREMRELNREVQYLVSYIKDYSKNMSNLYGGVYVCKIDEQQMNERYGLNNRSDNVLRSVGQKYLSKRLKDFEIHNEHVIRQQMQRYRKHNNNNYMNMKQQLLIQVKKQLKNQLQMININTKIQQIQQLRINQSKIQKQELLNHIKQFIKQQNHKIKLCINQSIKQVYFTQLSNYKLIPQIKTQINQLSHALHSNQIKISKSITQLILQNQSVTNKNFTSQITRVHNILINLIKNKIQQNFQQTNTLHKLNQKFLKDILLKQLPSLKNDILSQFHNLNQTQTHKLLQIITKKDQITQKSIKIVNANLLNKCNQLQRTVLQNIKKLSPNIIKQFKNIQQNNYNNIEHLLLYNFNQFGDKNQKSKKKYYQYINKTIKKDIQQIVVKQYTILDQMKKNRNQMMDEMYENKIYIEDRILDNEDSVTQIIKNQICALNQAVKQNNHIQIQQLQKRVQNDHNSLENLIKTNFIDIKRAYFQFTIMTQKKKKILLQRILKNLAINTNVINKQHINQESVKVTVQNQVKPLQIQFMEKIKSHNYLVSLKKYIQDYQQQLKKLYNKIYGLCYKAIIINLISPFFQNKIKSIQILYKASENQSLISIFWEKCQLKQKTITIIKTEYGKIIGGYNPNPWNYQINGHQKSQTKEQFIFSISQNDKFELISGQQNNAVSHRKNCGPTFGSSDLGIRENSLTFKNNYAYIENSYHNINYKMNDPKGWNKFIGNAGSYNFKIKQWEVFQIVFEN